MGDPDVYNQYMEMLEDDSPSVENTVSESPNEKKNEGNNINISAKSKGKPQGIATTPGVGISFQ